MSTASGAKTDPFQGAGLDIKLKFQPEGSADIDLEETVTGLDNLAQALLLRILVGEGELAALGHASFGSRVRELIGERLDRTNLELLRRLVREALKRDVRVAEVVSVRVTALPSVPGAVEVQATVRSKQDESLVVALQLDLG